MIWNRPYERSKFDWYTSETPKTTLTIERPHVIKNNCP